MDGSSVGAMMGILGGFFFIFLLIFVGIYLINGFGYMKLYKAAGYEPVWAAFVPVLSAYALGMFLKEENGDKEWVGWLLAFYWVLGLIPIIGTFAVVAGGIFRLVKQFMWLKKRDADVICYILLFVFPLAVPFLMVSKYSE